MTLIESHAAVIQNTLQRVYFPEANIETHWSLTAMLFQLVGADKLSQYQDGIPIVAAAMQNGDIDGLYHRLGTQTSGPAQ